MFFGSKGPRRRPGGKSGPPSGGDDLEATRISGPPRRDSPPGPAPERSQPPERPPDSGGEPRLMDMASPWFSTALALRHVASLPDADALRARLLTMKDEFEQAAKLRGTPPEDIEDSVFALVAMMDETVLDNRGPARDAWVRDPLMQRTFQHSLGGEQFFVHLEKVRADRRTRVQVLEVYACCLTLGFRGRFRMDPAGLANLEQQVLSEVTGPRGARPAPLAPHAAWRQEIVGPTDRGMAWWLPPALAVVAMLLTLLIIRVLSMILAGGVASAIGGGAS